MSKKNNGVKKGSQQAVEISQKWETILDGKLQKEETNYVIADQIAFYTKLWKDNFSNADQYFEFVFNENYTYLDDDEIVLLKKRFDRIGNFVQKHYFDKIVTPKLERFASKMAKAECIEELTAEEVLSEVEDQTYQSVCGTLVIITYILADARAFFHHRKERRAEKKLMRAAKKAARKAAKANK